MRRDSFHRVQVQVGASDYFGNLRFSHGRGAHCWTTDGREYIDLVCGQGPVVLGHAHPAVIAAVARQLQQGTLLPGPGPVFYELRDELLKLYPHSDDLITFKTGSEAVAAAMRLARAYTGRKAILRVGFHGWHDQMISPYLRCHSYDPATFDESWPLGVSHEAHSDLVRVWYGSDPRDLITAVRDTGQQLAAVILDPVQLMPPTIGPLATELANTLREEGALLICDESKTGFRVHLGGFQALYGIAADLTVLSKALANGLPLAGVLGKQDVMMLASGARIKGTFGSETASIAAALATIETLKQEDGPRALSTIGTRLINGLNDIIGSVGLQADMSAVPYQWPCMPYIRFAEMSHSLEDPFFVKLVQRGVLMLRNHMSYVSLALTRTDIDRVIDAAHYALKELVRDL